MGRYLVSRLVLLLVVGLASGWGCDAAPGGREPAPSEADSAAPPAARGDASLPIDASISPEPNPPGGGAAVPGAVSDPPELARARQRIVDYYAAIDAGDYERAYAAWSDEGRASGQTYLEFVAGFARTADVSVEVGEPGRIEGAAGSRYVEIPVVVTARRDDGVRQRFEGSYTLRRAVVDGATESQRTWHLYEASLQQVNQAGPRQSRQE